MGKSWVRTFRAHAGSAIFVLAPWLSGGALAQDAIPEAGAWQVDSRFRSQVLPNFRDRDDLAVRVTPCADRINLVHPSLAPFGAIILYFDGEAYVGAGQFVDRNGDIGGISFSVNVRSKTSIAGKMELDLGEIGPDQLAELRRLPPGLLETTRQMMQDALRQKHDVRLTYKGPQPGENFGYGQLSTTAARTENDGIFETEEVDYEVLLAEFEPQKYDLLALHKNALDQVILIGKSQSTDDLPEGHALCERTFHWRQVVSANRRFEGSVAGFADINGIEKSSGARLATGRANITADYLAAGGLGRPQTDIYETGAGFRGASGRGGPGCKRAAIAAFKVQTKSAKWYTEEETDRWLEQWLKQVHRDAAIYQQRGELDGLAPTPLANEGDRENARIYAKEVFCYANGLLEDKICPGAQDPNYDALTGADGGTRSGIRASYDKLPKDGIFVQTQNKTRADELAKSGRQSFCSEAVKTRADEIERQLFGNATEWLRINDD